MVFPDFPGLRKLDGSNSQKWQGWVPEILLKIGSYEYNPEKKHTHTYTLFRLFTHQIQVKNKSMIPIPVVKET